MKKLLAALLAAILLIACVPALVEEAPYEYTAIEELGLSLDFGTLQDKCANYVTLESDGTYRHDPYLALTRIIYYLISADEYDDIAIEYNQSGVERKKEINDYLRPLHGCIGFIAVSDTPTLEETGFDFDENMEVEEVAAWDGWHCYLITAPTDYLLPLFFDSGASGIEQPEAARKRMEADIELIHSELPGLLRAGEHDTPVDPNGALIGQKLQFETTDLDGNAVSSAALFAGNEITMVNFWGTWCGNCLEEMPELSELHTRLQEKGCGIVGLEFEGKGASVESFREKALEILSASGTNYPCALKPAGDPILDSIQIYPTTFFVDSQGTILTWPIMVPLVEAYEPTIDRLLAGESAGAMPEKASAAGAFRVCVRDAGGNPVEGAYIQLCDDSTCALQTTDASGIATFSVEAEKVYEVHVLRIPEGFMQDEQIYHTSADFSDVNIVLEWAK